MSNTATTPTQAATPSASATDVAEFFTDLDGGMFDRKLGIALSMVAAACMDTQRKGSVSIELSFEAIANTHQVAVHHKLAFVRPTADGKSTEEQKRATVLHVGQYGRLSLAQPALPGMADLQKPLQGL